jgi:hypothetical protein
MKINDVVITEGWQEGLRGLFSKAVDALNSGSATPDQAVRAIAKQTQKQWAAMVANARRNYGNKTVIEKAQLAGLLMQIGTPMRTGSGRFQVKKAAPGAPAIFADSKKVEDAFNTIYSESMAGREMSAGVFNALVDATEEAVSETQRKTYSPYGQPDAAQQPAADIEDRTELAKYHGKPLAGTEFDGLVNPESDEYENAIIPIHYINLRIRKKLRDGSEGEPINRSFVRYNGQWYIDINDDPDEYDLDDWDNEGDIQLLNSLISRVKSAVGGQTITQYPQNILADAPYGSKNMWMKRHGTLPDRFHSLSLPDALKQTFRGQK